MKSIEISNTLVKRQSLCKCEINAFNNIKCKVENRENSWQYKS